MPKGPIRKEVKKTRKREDEKVQNRIMLEQPKGTIHIQKVSDKVAA